MSPIVNGEILLDKDSFWRNEKGQLHMAHLVVSVATFVATGLAGASIWGYVQSIEGWLELLRVARDVFLFGMGLEGGQTFIESRNVIASRNVGGN